MIANHCLLWGLKLLVMSLTELWLDSLAFWGDIDCGVGWAYIHQCLSCFRFDWEIVRLSWWPCWYSWKIPLDVCLLQRSHDFCALQPSWFGEWFRFLVRWSLLGVHWVHLCCQDVDWTATWVIVVESRFPLDFEDFAWYGFRYWSLVGNICLSRLITSPPQDGIGK